MGKISLGVCLMFLVVSSTVYEVQGTFLLRHYMRRCPLRRRAFRPFACKGMLSFCDLLQRRCPLTPQYSNFFSKMKSFLSVIQSSSGSSNFDADLKTQAQGLQSAMSQMGGGSSGSADSSKVINVLMSMGKTLGDTEKSGSVIMTRSQRRELIFSMITWARTIAQYVMTSTSKNGGASMNMSSLGIDDDGDSPKSGGSPGGPTGSSPGAPTGGSPGGPIGGSPGGPTGGSPGGPIGGSPGGPIGGSPGGSIGGSHGGSTGSSSGSSTSGSTGSMGFTAGSTGGSPKGTPNGSSSGSASGSTGSTGFTAGSTGSSSGSSTSGSTGSMGFTAGSTGGSTGGSPKGTPNGSSGGSASGSTGSTGFTAGSTGSTGFSAGSTGGSTGSSCNTCNGGNTNGGSSFKGSMNFQQQAGKQMSQDSSVNSSH